MNVVDGGECPGMDVGCGEIRFEIAAVSQIAPLWSVREEDLLASANIGGADNKLPSHVAGLSGTGGALV